MSRGEFVLGRMFFVIVLPSLFVQDFHYLLVWCPRGSQESCSSNFMPRNVTCEKQGMPQTRVWYNSLYAYRVSSVVYCHRSRFFCVFDKSNKLSVLVGAPAMFFRGVGTSTVGASFGWSESLSATSMAVSRMMHGNEKLFVVCIRPLHLILLYVATHNGDIQRANKTFTITQNASHLPPSFLM